MSKKARPRVFFEEDFETRDASDFFGSDDKESDEVRWQHTVCRSARIPLLLVTSPFPLYLLFLDSTEDDRHRRRLRLSSTRGHGE